MNNIAERSKTFRWTDPGIARQQAGGMTGLEIMRALRDGTLPPPPMAVLSNANIIEAEPGKVRFMYTPGEEHYNPLGTVHGGLACTMLDTVVGCAAHTTLEAGVGYTSIELTVKYLRPITIDTGSLFAVGAVVKGGRRVIFADGLITDHMGTPLATATSSLLVLPQP